MISSAVDIARPPGKILVIKICCLGDVIFLTPSLRALRTRFPYARISLMTSSWVLPIAEQIPFIDDVLVFDAPLRRKLNGKSIGELFRIIGKLRKEKYDAAICGHRNKLFSWLGYLSGIPTRIGFAEGRSRCINHPVSFCFDQHEIKRYGELVKEIGAEMTDFRTEISPVPERSNNTDGLFLQIKAQSGDCLVGIMAGGGQNPGTSMHIKRWGAENYRDLINRILVDPKMKIFLLGASTDNELNESVLTGINAHRNNVYNIAGKLSLSELPGFLGRLQVVIGGDTGPVHLAAAVGTKAIFLFGPSDPRLVAPMGSSSVYLWKQVDCSPCYTPVTVMQKGNFRGNEFFCRTDTRECLRKLTVGEVYEVFLKLIGSGNN